MGKKNILTHRFCFGTPDNPGSAVWRLNTFVKGDVYLHNHPQFGNDIHIALHASGKFSAKLGTDRFKLQPPFKDSNGLYWGPVMFFRKWSREVPPPPPSGQIQKVCWLGWPKAGSLFILKMLYVPANVGWVLHEDDRLLFNNIPARLFHAEMSLHILLQEREMINSEVSVCMHKPEVLEFSSPIPQINNAEMIRISKTDLGPSAIIHEPFVLSYPSGSEI
jgi:hypothetical protein